MIDPALKEESYALQKHLGFEMTEWSEGFAQFELPIAPHLGNRYGIPHGGVYATLLDTAMGFCGCYTGDPNNRVLGMTLSMTVNYEAQAKGKLLIGTGRRTGGGAKTFFAEGLVVDELGTRIASGTGVFRLRGS